MLGRCITANYELFQQSNLCFTVTLPTLGFIDNPLKNLLGNENLITCNSEIWNGALRNTNSTILLSFI